MDQDQHQKKKKKQKTITNKQKPTYIMVTIEYHLKHVEQIFIFFLMYTWLKEI